MERVLSALSFGNKALIIALQRIAPLAGSAVAMPEKASDLDFFILNNDEMALFEIIYLILPFATHFTQSTSNDYPDQWTLLTFQLKEEHMSIQLILTDCKSAEDVTNTFDMDYVQCAMYRDRLLIAECAQKALDDNHVNVIQNYDRCVRFQKALVKKMHLPVFFNKLANTSKTQFDPIAEFQSKTIKLNPLTKRSMDVIDTHDVKIVGFANRHSHHKMYHNFVLQTPRKKKIEVRYVALRCVVLDIQHEGGPRSLLQFANVECGRWLKIRCPVEMTIERNKTQIVIVELSSSIDTHGRFYLDVVDVWDDTPYVTDMSWSELLLEMELATTKDTRQLSAEAHCKLIARYAETYNSNKSTNDMEKDLNHICAQVFEALLYYIQQEKKANPFAFVAFQFFIDLDKQFNYSDAQLQLYLQSFKDVTSLGVLTSLVKRHYERILKQ